MNPTLHTCPECGCRYAGTHSLRVCVENVISDARRLTRKIGADSAPVIFARRQVLLGRIR